MADAFPDEAEQGFTIDEYIEDLEAAELEADMVLGGDDGKECTYSNGYMKRQAVFSCLTCVPAGNAGVCTACTLSCHDGHEVIELWTKRKFKCDCGNSKFGEFYCKLFPSKESENLENRYNQNFKGAYCTCGRPYPDPEAVEQVEMIQCCICEDWFHESHIGLDSTEEIPRDEEGEPLYEEFICQNCAVTVSFLKYYPASIWSSSRQSNTAESSQEKHASADGPNGASTGESSKDIENGTSASESIASHPTAVADTVTHTGKGSLHGENSVQNLCTEKDSGLSNDTVISGNCILGLNLSATPVIVDKKKPMFLSKKWRELLCRCENCREFYAKNGTDFLIDKEDSMDEYEKMAKQRREEKLQKQEGAELKFMDKLDHIQKIEILNGINDMKNELASFLESFDPSKTITAADVQGIFKNLSNKRKRF